MTVCYTWIGLELGLALGLALAQAFGLALAQAPGLALLGPGLKKSFRGCAPKHLL